LICIKPGGQGEQPERFFDVLTAPAPIGVGPG
jgi:hypothetical protein